jgi:Uma2 family endonuclease
MGGLRGVGADLTEAAEPLAAGDAGIAGRLRITAFLVAVLRGWINHKRLGGMLLHAHAEMRQERGGREPDVIYLGPVNARHWGERYEHGPADLVVEVVSPAGPTNDRRGEYARSEVAEYWRVDPARHTAEVHTLSPGGVYEPVPAGDPPRMRSVVLPGLWIDPAWLWSEAPDEAKAYAAWGLT